MLYIWLVSVNAFINEGAKDMRYLEKSEALSIGGGNLESELTFGQVQFHVAGSRVLMW